MSHVAFAPSARLVLPRRLLLKAAHHHEGMYSKSAGYYLLAGRWHKLKTGEKAPKGAPVAAHPQAAGQHLPSAHFTDDQWAALKLPDSNVNAPSYNKALDKLKEWSDAGNVTAIVGAGYGSNTYGQKLAKVANHLLGLHGSAHKVAAGQKSGEHAAVQSGPAEPHPSGLPEHLAPKTTQGLQEPGGMSPLAQHVKDSLDQKAADGDVEFIKLVAANNPEHPQIVAYAKQKLAELGAASTTAAAPALPDLDSPEDMAANHEAAPALAMPAFDEGKTTTGVKAYYEKQAKKVIDHGLAGNVAVLDGMKDVNGKSWQGKTANSKKLLALHAAALAYAKGETKPAPAPDHSAHDTPASKVLHVIPSSDAKAGYEVHVATPKSAPGSKFSVVVKDVDSGEFLPTVKTFQSESAALEHAHALADGKKPGTGPKEGDTKPAADGGTLVLKDGHWVKQGGDDPTAVKPEHFEVSAGDVFKLDSQYQKMNAGEWVVYNVSADGAQVYMHKVGAKVPNQTSSATIPAATLAEAVAKGTAKKQPVLSTGGVVDGPLKGWSIGAKVEALPKEKLQRLVASPGSPDKVKAHAAAVLAAKHGPAPAAEAWNALTTDQKASILALVSPLYTTDYTGKPNAAAKKMAAAGWGALTDQVKSKVTPYISMHAHAKQEAAAKPAPVMPEKPVAADPVADNDQSPLKTIGGITFEAVKSGAVWKVKVAGTDKLIDGIHSDSKGGLWSKLSQHHGSVGADSFASEFGGKTETPLSPQQLQNLQSIPWFKLKLPAENANAKSHNAAVAKIEAMAFAGDKAGLQAFIDAKAGAKQTYAKKQVLTAQTALAGLQVHGATAAVAVEPAPAVAPAPAASEKITSLTRKQVAGLHGWLQAGQPTSKHPDSWSNLWKKLSSNMKAAVKAEMKTDAPPAAKPPVTADTPLTQLQKDAVDAMSMLDLQVLAGDDQPLPPNVKVAVKKKLAEKQAAATPKPVSAPKTILHNTLPGHSKSWSVYVAPNASGGFDMVTEHGKIGDTQQKTVKSYATAGEANTAAIALKNEKFKKGYVQQPTDYDHTVPAPGTAANPAPAAPTGPVALDAGKLDALKASVKGHSNSEFLKTLKPAALSGDTAAIQKWKAANAGKLPNTQKLADKILAAMGGPKEGDTKQGADGLLVLKNGHWVKVGGEAPEPDAHPSMDAWTKIGEQGGSNPGGKFRDPSGQEWYCKWPSDPDAIASEVLAAKLYALAGLSSQDCMVVTKGGKPAIATKWVNIKKAGTAAALAKTPGALDGFAVDAWLGNWDVVGQTLDNLQVGPDGKAHRVDAGGSLEYRAQGDKKPFGASVDEIDTLRDASKNEKAAAVFGKMTAADITASVAKVLAIDDASIRAMVAEHGPGDEAARKALADTLIARKADLFKRYPKAAKPGTKKPLDRSALPIDPKTIPKPHDFENWNGAGKGLSSKAAVNQANVSDEYAMLALAQAGNLTALKTFQFTQVDKDTGAPTGAKLPISQHPSKHVVQYHSDLVQLLDEVANPPEPLKVFRTTDVGTVAGLSAAFPPKPFGTTVSKVSSNEKLGFWVALGAITGISKFKPKATHDYSTAAVHAAKEKYKTASALAKHFISSVQASGSYNDLFRDGKTTDGAGNKLTDVAKAALAHATEMPEGTSLYRWQKISPQMLPHIMSAKEGTVFQATGPMCTSYHPTATKNFGTHRVKIRYAKGAKAVESFASGAFGGEKEVTTLPNARFVILSKQMVPDVEHGNPGAQRLELEILMLPPDLGIKE